MAPLNECAHFQSWNGSIGYSITSATHITSHDVVAGRWTLSQTMSTRGKASTPPKTDHTEGECSSSDIHVWTSSLLSKDRRQTIIQLPLCLLYLMLTANLYQYIDDCHWYTCTSTSALHPPLTIFSLVRPFYYLLNGLRRSANVFAFDFWFWTFECCIFSLLIALQTWWLIFSDDLYVGQPSLWLPLQPPLLTEKKVLLLFFFRIWCFCVAQRQTLAQLAATLTAHFQEGRKERAIYWQWINCD